MLTYNFNSNKVGAILGDDDEPYFVVEDICDILKIPNGRLSDEDKITHKLNDEQEIIVTSEFGLYELIMNSVGEKDFKRWILRKILPVIRTTAQIKSYPSQEMIHVLAVQKEISFDEGYKESYLSFNATVKLSGVRKDVMKKALRNPKSGVYLIFYGTTVPTQKTAKLIQQWESGWKKMAC